jgi:hypothetical protein
LFTRTRARMRKKMKFGQGVTRDMDRRQIYRRRSMPRYRRKRWVRFLKKVNAVNEKTLGKRTYIFKPNVDTLASNNYEVQKVGTYGMYTIESAQPDMRHLQRIMETENTGSTTMNSDDGAVIYNDTKLQFKSAILDMTFSNRSTVNSETPSNSDELAASCPIEVDIYEMAIGRKAYARNLDDTVTTFENIQQMLSHKPSMELENPAGFTKFTFDPETRGLTPWDFSTSLGQFRMKIYKKTKFLLKNGEYFTYQMRDPRSHNITRSQIQDCAGFNMPGITKLIYVTMKPVPGTEPDIGSIPGNINARLLIGRTIKYTYCLEGANEDRHFVLNDS